MAVNRCRSDDEHGRHAEKGNYMLRASVVAQNSQSRYPKFDDGDRLSKGGGGGGGCPKKEAQGVLVSIFFGSVDASVQTRDVFLGRSLLSL